MIEIYAYIIFIELNYNYKKGGTKINILYFTALNYIFISIDINL